VNFRESSYLFQQKGEHILVRLLPIEALQLLIGNAQVSGQLQLSLAHWLIAALHSLVVDERLREESLPVDLELGHGEVLPISILAEDAQS
jgi:hypothetical protein